MKGCFYNYTVVDTREILSDWISLAGRPSRNHILHGCVKGLNGELYQLLLKFFPSNILLAPIVFFRKATIRI